MKIFVAGEGPSEIGDWADHATYRQEPPAPGVIEALLRRIVPDGLTIAGGRVWRAIRKYKPIVDGRPEIRNVLGAALHAKEAGCEALAFVRDRDGDKDREKQIDEGIRRALEVIESCPRIAGGVAIEAMESWLLSLQGTRQAELIHDPKAKIGSMPVQRMVEIVEAADLADLLGDASSLRSWLAGAKAVCKPHGA